MTDAAELLKAIAALLWVVLAAVALLLLAGVLRTRAGALKSFGVGPSGLTFEFVEAKVDQAIAAASQQAGVRVGHAAKRSVIDRLQRNADLLARARILWVDDHPENNVAVLELLRRYGSIVDTPVTNADAFRLLQGARYDVLISDVARDNEGPNSDQKGLDFARQVYQNWGQQSLLFTARFDPTTVPGLDDEERLALVREMNRIVFGRTNRLDIAIHLILDVLERQGL
jgi:CheY-like chemotaxis protein